MYITYSQNFIVWIQDNCWRFITDDDNPRYKFKSFFIDPEGRLNIRCTLKGSDCVLLVHDKMVGAYLDIVAAEMRHQTEVDAIISTARHTVVEDFKQKSVC